VFVIILFLLGLTFGYATKLPTALLAFLVPIALALAATDRSAGAVVVGFLVTAIGLLAGIVLAQRAEARPSSR
jgi:ABC-type transport system involved in cytochrome c biogenesis permease subunit